MAELLTAPRWTELMYRPVGGQDHLGVGSVVTDRILPTLSPGINVLTPHPRYWSFYAFVVDEFWQRDLPRTGPSLRRFLRRREAIFSAGGHLCSGPEHRATPIGSRRVAPLVQSGPRSYQADFDYMKSTGGGYSLYYATVMQAMGVVRLADKGLGLPVDTVTPGIGKQLADSFRDSISGTRYWKKYFDADLVPAAVVEEYGNAACLCRVQSDTPDREPLVDAFLHGGHLEPAAARRTTLQMFLELAHQTREVGLNQDDFRRLVLYQSTYDPQTEHEVATFSPTNELLSVSRRWRLSQLREMFNWSLNGMWQWVADWGIGRNGDVFAIAVDDLFVAVESAALEALPGLRSKMTDPISVLVDECRTLSSTTDSLDGRWELWTDLTEDQLFGWSRDSELDDATRLAALFLLYVLCLARLWDPSLPQSIGAEDWSPVREGGARRIGMQFALDQLRRDAEDGVSVKRVIRRVIEQHVVAQHERVALAKLPEDTFRFRRESERLRFAPMPTAFQRNDSRFNALSTACAELGWSGFFADDGHGLSPEGEILRIHGDLAAPGATQ